MNDMWTWGNQLNKEKNKDLATEESSEMIIEEKCFFFHFGISLLYIGVRKPTL